MSETPNNEEIDPREGLGAEDAHHDALDEAKAQQEQIELMTEDEAVKQAESMAEDGLIKLPPTPLVQAREVILPVIMRKGEDIAVLGDAVYDAETSKMVVTFNTAPGRDIAEFIGSGMLAAVSFQGHMSRSQHFNK